MASENDTDQTEGDDAAKASAEAETPAPNRKRKLILIAIAVLVVIGASGGAAWWFLGRASNEDKVVAAGPIVAEQLVDVPPMTVNLRTADGGSKFLRVHLMLVPGSLDKAAIDGQLPLVIDSFQPFLRELRPEDIAGSAATFRIKEEMLLRANAVLGVGAVRDVLIQDLVQQ